MKQHNKETEVPGEAPPDNGAKPLNGPERRILVAALAALFLVVVFVAIALALEARVHAASEFVGHTHQVMSCVNNARARFGDARSAQRGYLLTGDRGFLDNRDRALLQFNAAMRQCADLTADNPRQQRRIRELRVVVAEVDQQFDRQVALYDSHQRVDLTAGIEDARSKSDAMQTLFDELNAEEGSLLEARQAADRQLSLRLEWFLIALAAVFAILLLGAAAAALRISRQRHAANERFERVRRAAREAVWQRQQLVLDSAPAAMLMVDTGGSIVFVNAQLATLFGYGASDLLGKSIEMLVPERFRAVHGGLRRQYFEAPVARMMGAGRELFGLCSDGTEIPVEIGLNPLDVDEGRFVLASVVDLTGRRREEERLRIVVEAAPSAMLMVNARGFITLVNSQVENLFGYTREELLGQPVEILVPMRLRQAHTGFRERFGQQPTARAMGAGRELYGLRHDGSEVPIEIGLNPIETPEGRFVLASVIDISERKRAVEVELRRASEALASRFEETRAAALTLFNTEFDEQRILAGTLDLLAERHQFPVILYYSADSLGGLLHLTAARGAPADAAVEIRIGDGLVGTAAQNGRVLHVDRIDVAAATGVGDLSLHAGFARLPPAALLFCPVSYRGQLLGVMALGASEPISEVDRAAVERLAAQLGAALHNIRQYANLQVLAQQLRERGEEIQLKNNQLEAASRMKSEFLANMSHELRTPLNAIIGFAEVLKDGLAGELNPQQGECVTDIFESGQHLLALINDILDLSKIESGRLEADYEAADPIAIVESGLTVVREKAMSQRVRLTGDWPDDLGTLALDVRKVKQIAYNLLSNAVKFTPEGGEVRTALRRAGREALETALASGRGRMFSAVADDQSGFLVLSVTDTGIGIEPADLQRLFEPFTQVDSALSRRHAGTGLGLVMIRRLTELLGGALVVDSTPGAGSTFSVWLPWLAPPETVAPGVPQLAPRVDASRPPQVLVVEDRAQDAQLLRLQLQDAGYRVEVADSAEAALSAVVERVPDAIVLDVILPGMDGWEFLARLKSDAGLADIPVVIVSITDEAQHGFVLGAADVLVKPVTQGELMEALRSAGLLPSEPRKVLVVDDDPRTVGLLSGQLQSAGFRVVAAYGGRDGIELAQREAPDLIVLDLLMPDLNGFDVVTRLRELEATIAIPILVLTAHDMSPAERAALRGSVMKVLEKSEFNADQFLAEVHRVVRRHCS